jgi:hypothetical protein
MACLQEALGKDGPHAAGADPAEPRSGVRRHAFSLLLLQSFAGS